MRNGVLFRARGISAISLLIAMNGAGAVAWAQDGPPEGQDASSASDAAASDRSGEEVIVTGSRLGRTSFNSPTPVNVLGQERTQNLNITNVADALNQIPAFRPIANPATTQQRSSANIAGRTLDLRGLGAVRTLTLIDGRRHVPTGDDGTFDLNSIPSILVERSEVVTGGASAAYGAGAVAGVVNLILNTRFEGIRAEASFGISQRGDAGRIFVAGAAGTGFAGGRGHVVIGGEFSDEREVGSINTRAWSRRYHDFIPNPFFSTNPALSNGLPANIGIDNVRTSYTPAGTIQVVHPLQGMQFDSNGNLVPFQFGDLYNTAKPSALMVGGDPSITDYYSANGPPFLVPTRHVSVLGHVEYQLTDSITASAQLGYAKIDGGPTGSNPRSDANGAIRIQRDNAYLTPQVAAMMDAAGVTFLPVSRVNTEIGANVYSSTNEVWQAFVGLRGELGARWDWDVHYQFGRTDGLQFNSNARLEQRFKDSIDAVFVTPQNVGNSGLPIGSIVCRSTLTNPNNGCIPSNVMGPGRMSREAVDWINTIAYSTRRFTDHNFAANVRGTLLEGWAGPILAAAGVEYRTNASRGDNDPNSKLNLFSQQAWTFLPATTQKVTEGYLEVNVPIFAESPLGRSFDVDGAIRRTHYSISGNATTWKVGAVYRLNDEYMLRVTRSRDIRAPSPAELNPNRSILAGQITDPKYNIRYFVSNYSGGNPDLNLERANTLTIGGVVRPRWIWNLQVSLDYYDIRVSGAIDIPNADLAVALCRAGTNPAICTLGVDENGNPDRILALFSAYQNLSALRAKGFELVANYRQDLARIASFLAGNLDITLNGSYVQTLSITLPNGRPQELSNWTGNTGLAASILGVPRWRGDAVITYSRPSFSLTAHMSYIPRGLLNPNWIGPEQEGYSPYLPNSVNYNHVSSRFYLDLNGRVRVSSGSDREFEFFGGIKNVLDTDPPRQIRLNGNPLYFDPIGRQFTLGVRVNL
jgi:iron complex outermembrane receptor protein